MSFPLPFHFTTYCPPLTCWMNCPGATPGAGTLLGTFTVLVFVFVVGICPDALVYLFRSKSDLNSLLRIIFQIGVLGSDKGAWIMSFGRSLEVILISTVCRVSWMYAQP